MRFEIKIQNQMRRTHDSGYGEYRTNDRISYLRMNCTLCMLLFIRIKWKLLTISLPHSRPHLSPSLSLSRCFIRLKMSHLCAPTLFYMYSHVDPFKLNVLLLPPIPATNCTCSLFRSCSSGFIGLHNETFIKIWCETRWLCFIHVQKSTDEFCYAPYLVSKQKCFTSRIFVTVHKITINFV